MTGEPWRPPSVRRWHPGVDAMLAGGEMAYLVVDDLDSGVAGVVFSRWPHVDAAGRLHFDQDADVRVAVDAAALQALLDERVPVVEGPTDQTRGALSGRPLQVGDAFAASLRRFPRKDVETPEDPGQWIAGPIVDISLDAREAAKVQYYAAIGVVLTEAEVDEIAQEMMGEGPSGTEPPDGEGGPPVRPRAPSGAGSGGGGTSVPTDEERPDTSAYPHWLPPSLRRWRADADELITEGGMAYVVVDDLDSGVAGLVVNRWPRVDDAGRLYFDGRAVGLAVDAVAFHELLYDRVPPVAAGGAEVERQLSRRPLQVGDAFAISFAELPAEDVETPADPRDWISGPIVDVSTDAREEAKVQYYAAVGEVLTEDEVDEIAQEFRDEGGLETGA